MTKVVISLWLPKPSRTPSGRTLANGREMKYCDEDSAKSSEFWRSLKQSTWKFTDDIASAVVLYNPKKKHNYNKNSRGYLNGREVGDIIVNGIEVNVVDGQYFKSATN